VIFKVNSGRKLCHGDSVMVTLSRWSARWIQKGSSVMVTLSWWSARWIQKESSVMVTLSWWSARWIQEENSVMVNFKVSWEGKKRAAGLACNTWTPTLAMKQNEVTLVTLSICLCPSWHPIVNLNHCHLLVQRK
jgi:hypothetical protein